MPEHNKFILPEELRGAERSWRGAAWARIAFRGRPCPSRAASLLSNTEFWRSEEALPPRRSELGQRAAFSGERQRFGGSGDANPTFRVAHSGLPITTITGGLSSLPGGCGVTLAPVGSEVRHKGSLKGCFFLIEMEVGVVSAPQGVVWGGLQGSGCLWCPSSGSSGVSPLLTQTREGRPALSEGGEMGVPGKGSKENTNNL